jgi:hypothetical protein
MKELNYMQLIIKFHKWSGFDGSITAKNYPWMLAKAATNFINVDALPGVNRGAPWTK